MAKQRPSLYGITSDQARRIRRACERIEGTPPGRAFGDASRAIPWNPGIQRAKVTTAISTGTFASPSSDGRVQLYVKNAAGSWEASGDPVEVLNDNPLDSSIPVGRTIKVGWIAGEWWVVSGACKNEA